MERIWTGTLQHDWIARRESYRKSRSRPSLEELRVSKDHKDQEALQAALRLERSKIRERLEAYYTKTVPWDIEKRPSTIYPAPIAGSLELPLHYRQSRGSVQIHFNKGDDLNFITYNFYSQSVDSVDDGVNYVSEDGIKCFRHEYLGPAPTVVGYQFDVTERRACIEWWDRYLDKKWIGTGTWKIELYFDVSVYGWVSRPRHHLDDSLDLREYLGSD